MILCRKGQESVRPCTIDMAAITTMDEYETWRMMNRNWYSTTEGNWRYCSKYRDPCRVTWMDIQRDPYQDIDLSWENRRRENREYWFWKGDKNLPLINDTYYRKMRYSPHYPNPPRLYNFNSRKAYNFGAWVGKGLVNDRDPDEKNQCLCEIRLDNCSTRSNSRTMVW